MPGHDIVVIGGSAGALEVLQNILAALPADLPAALFVALHRPDLPLAVDALSATVSKSGGRRVEAAIDGKGIEYGHVYLAPSGSHLIIQRGAMRIEHSPRESRFRPSVDALFRSAAMAYGRRVVGVLLSGMLSDGTVGLWQIRKHGGITVVQRPEEAAFSSMPKEALENVRVDYCLSALQIAGKIAELAWEPSAPSIRGMQKARVLIVEDERIVTMNLSQQLGELGYEVAGMVASGEETLELVPIAKPDIVLMDIQLEGKLPGTETARLLWEKYQIPVVYLTAHADADTLDAVKRSTPFGFIVKPFRCEQVHAEIQLALDRYEREMLMGPG